MMKRPAIFFMLSMVMLWFFQVAYASGENSLVLGADMRLRYEYQNNFNQKYYGDNPELGSDDDGFLLGRFRAGLDYTPSDRIHLALWVQDSEVWGMALPDSAFYQARPGFEHNPNKESWDLSDTYIEVKRVFDLPITIKGGRQRICYGNRRIFGPGQWGNTGRWIWDAARISYTFEKGFIDTYYGRTVIHEPDAFSLSHRHYYASFGSYSRFILPSAFFAIVLEPFFMTKRDHHDTYRGEDGMAGDLNAGYAGIRVFREDVRGFDVDITYIRAFGDYASDDLKAYGCHARLAYHFNGAVMDPRLSIEYSLASGDADPTDGDRETFDGAFGARDKMYGRMNLFHWKNIEDAQINLEGKPRDACVLRVEFHRFRLNEEKDAWYLNPGVYRDKTGASGDKVGKELDIVVKVTLPCNHEIQLGCGHFWPDAFVKRMASRKQATWAFLQWQYRFSLNVL